MKESKLKWFDLVQFDEPIMKSYNELSTWDVIATAYGCSSNKGLWTVYKKRIDGNFEGDVNVQLWTYNVHEGVRYCPICPQYSSVVELLLTDKGYFTRQDMMSSSLYSFTKSIDEKLDKKEYKVVGKLVESSQEVG